MWKLRLRPRKSAIPRKGIHKWDFRCSVHRLYSAPSDRNSGHVCSTYIKLERYFLTTSIVPPLIRQEKTDVGNEKKGLYSYRYYSQEKG